MSKTAAIYARVSSDRQKEQNTIASQLSALQEYAQAHQYTVPAEWVFADEGYSGSVLVRPALERLRDLIAEGAIETLLIYEPDRLSRKHAYQVLLLEEFARHGATALFLKAPVAETPEQKLMLDLQGIIAEYERAHILERCRRGKRYRAKAGDVGVLSAAPYGYQYMRKTEQSQAYYQILEREAEVVRQVFELYTVEGLSIRKIVQQLNTQGVATRRRKVWLHTTVWGMLKNPAYQGKACFGKTERALPQKPTRTRRRKGSYASGNSVHRQRPPEEWIEIPVPPLVSKETFELAQQRLELNQQLSARRTKQPSLLQGLLVCAGCGYALIRVGARAHGQGCRYRYYRCLGSDRRQSPARLCPVRPVRVERLDELVWEQLCHLLNHPELIRNEIQRRLEEHRQSSPVEQRKEQVGQEIVRIQQQTDKLIDAYQEGVMGLSDLRARVPELKRRQLALEKELQNITLQSLEQDRLLAMNSSMEKFTEQLRHSAQKLDIEQKQKIVRLLVRQVEVGTETVTIHHSIPIPAKDTSQSGPIYRLCTSRPAVPRPVNIGFREF